MEITEKVEKITEKEKKFELKYGFLIKLDTYTNSVDEYVACIHRSSWNMEHNPDECVAYEIRPAFNSEIKLWKEF